VVTFESPDRVMRPRRPRDGKELAVRVLNYLTNHIVAHVPSFTVRHAWYRRVLGISLGSGSGVHMGCYVWFFGPGHLRRSGLGIGANTRINRDCCLDARGSVQIGDNVSISPEVAILTTQHRLEAAGFPVESRPVVIGTNDQDCVVSRNGPYDFRPVLLIDGDSE
jgi:acetyltransferase-like isoleucine patch superfamily enzyme